MKMRFGAFLKTFGAKKHRNVQFSGLQETRAYLGNAVGDYVIDKKTPNVLHLTSAELQHSAM